MIRRVVVTSWPPVVLDTFVIQVLNFFVLHQTLNSVKYLCLMRIVDFSAAIPFSSLLFAFLF